MSGVGGSLVFLVLHNMIVNAVRWPFTVTRHLLPNAWKASHARGSVACLSEYRKFTFQLLQFCLNNVDISRYDLKIAVFDCLVQFVKVTDCLLYALPYGIPLLMVAVEVVADAGLGQFVSVVGHDHLQ